MQSICFWSIAASSLTACNVMASWLQYIGSIFLLFATSSNFVPSRSRIAFRLVWSRFFPFCFGWRQVLVLLFLLMTVCPNSVFLNRGNHEDFGLCCVYGFQKECLNKYNDVVFR